MPDTFNIGLTFSSETRLQINEFILSWYKACVDFYARNGFQRGVYMVSEPFHTILLLRVIPRDNLIFQFRCLESA